MNEVNRMLEETAMNDSAVRAINLQQMLMPKWSQERNAYAIMSSLDEKAQKRVEALLK